MSTATPLAERGSSPPAAPSRWLGDSSSLVLVVLSTAALAWFALVFTHGGDGSVILDHHRLDAGEPTATGQHHGEVDAQPVEPPAAGLATQALVVLGGWAVMVVAMMVPPALPMLTVASRLVAGQRYARLLLITGAATFVAAWTVVGAGMIAGDAGLHALTTDLSSGWHLEDLVPGAVLVGAGIYQLTPLKQSCLRACRSPRSFALAHWRGQRPPVVELVRMTGAYALTCIGCCWALMAISFAVGVAALPVMVALTVFMAAERLVPWGRRLTRPAGVLLIVAGAVIALRPFLTGPVVG